MLVTRKGLSVTETVTTLFKLTSWTNWPILKGKITKTGQFNIKHCISAMLVTLKGVSVT